MEMLDKANTESLRNTDTDYYVMLNVEKGPFIIISGHDLLDLKIAFGADKG